MDRRGEFLGKINGSNLLSWILPFNLTEVWSIMFVSIWSCRPGVEASFSSIWCTVFKVHFNFLEIKTIFGRDLPEDLMRNADILSRKWGYLS